jgi:hypothetical protein
LSIDDIYEQGKTLLFEWKEEEKEMDGDTEIEDVVSDTVEAVALDSDADAEFKAGKGSDE